MAIVFFFGNAVLVSLTDLYMSNTRARCHSLGTVKVSYHSLNSKKLSNKDSQFDEYPQCGGSSSEGPFDDLKSRGCLAGRTLLVQGANMFLICANHFFFAFYCISFTFVPQFFFAIASADDDFTPSLALEGSTG